MTTDGNAFLGAALGAAVDKAVTDATAVLDEALADLAAELAQVTAERDAAEQAYDEHMTEFHTVTPPPPPPDPEPTATIIGASDGQWPIPGITKVPGIRAFLGPGARPTTWANSSELRNATDRTAPGGIVWISWKEGGTDWLDQLLASRPPGFHYIGTFNHEPENDTNPDPAGYQATWAEQLPILRKHGVKAATCLLGHMSDAQNEPFHVDGVDYVGFDRYNPGLGNAKSYTDPVKVFARVLAYARNKGLPLAIGETGTIVVDGTTSADRAAWAKKVRDHLAAQPDVVCVLWWNQSRMAIDSNTSAVWF